MTGDIKINRPACGVRLTAGVTSRGPDQLPERTLFASETASLVEQSHDAIADARSVQFMTQLNHDGGVRLNEISHFIRESLSEIAERPECLCNARQRRHDVRVGHLSGGRQALAVRGKRQQRVMSPQPVEARRCIDASQGVLGAPGQSEGPKRDRKTAPPWLT